MASCEALLSLDKPGCGGDTPGASATAYYCNTSDLSAFVDGTTGVVTNVTFKPGKGWKRVQARKGSVNGRSFIEGDQTTGTSFTHEVTFRASDLSVDARNFVQGLKSAETIWLVESKSAGWQLYGVIEDGLRMVQGDDSMLAGEEFGELVVMRVTEMDEKRLSFFDTDEATTIANIVENVVAS